MRVFAFQRFIHISRPHRGMCQLEKPRANEITAPPALTARKLELRGKAMVSQSRFRRTRFSCGQSWGKQKESDVLRMIEPQALVTFGKIFSSIRMKFVDLLLFWSWLCFAFYPRTFLRSGTFHADEIEKIWFGKCDHT